MKYCSKCGKELLDEAVFCPGCGCKAEGETPQNPIVSPANAATKKSDKKKLLLIIPAAVLVVVGILAFMIFRPHDLKMDDFKDNGYIGALFSYGIPTSITDDGIFYYEDCIKFYGIPVSDFMYEPGVDCVMWFNSDNRSEAHQAIRKHCDLDNYGSVADRYSYRDLRIRVSGSNLLLAIIDFR